MKLIVMIPAFNEENTLGRVIDEIPKKIKGFTEIQVLVIDDGSTDATPIVAREKKAIVYSHATNKGLARTFQDGLNYAFLELGADVVVNTDADMQYNQTQIPLLTEQVLEKHADMVLGSRFKGWIEEMPFSKRWGNRLATWALSVVAGINISDGQTGFRAFSREAGLRLNVLSSFTYTQETILQAAYYKLKIVEVPIEFRKRHGQSRLFSSVWGYASRSIRTLVMGYLNYKPLKAFSTLGGIFALGGAGLGAFVLNHFFKNGVVTPHLPAAILSGVLIIFGALIIFLGLIAEMVKQNRLLEEESLFRQKMNSIIRKKKSRNNE